MRKEACAWLSAINIDQQYDAFLFARLDETCEWIMHKLVCSKWADFDFSSSNVKFLWIHKSASYEKSVLCVKCIQFLMITSTSTFVYFFCSVDFEIQRNSFAILRSFVWQVATRNEIALEWINEQYRGQNSISAFQSDLWRLLQFIVNHVSNCIFVIDEFDECKLSDEKLGKVENTRE